MAFSLARALAERKEDRARATELARGARQELVGIGWLTERRETLEAWMTARHVALEP